MTYLPLYGHSRPKAFRSVNGLCCHQTAVRPLLQVCPQHVGPRRAAVIPSASESLCNFGEIYTQKTYPTASFFALPPSLCFPSLSGLPEWRHSLLLLRDITLCTASGSWFHLFTLSPAFSLPVRFWLQMMHLNFPLRQVQAVMQGTRVWFIYTNTHRADLK